MDISLQKVEHGSKEAFENLFQLFAYDFSELNNMDISEDGRYQGLHDIEDYYSKPNYCSYFVRMDGKLAGVAVLRFDENVNYFRHFFILRKYRRKKVGLNTAEIIFESAPGNWRVSVFDFNQPAIQFWNNVIDSYTNGAYIVRRRTDDKGIDLLFRNMK